MAQHFALCGTLQDHTKKWKEGDHDLSKEDKMVYMKSLLHLADISNPFKQWTMCKYWSDRVFAEFYDQGDREKKRGYLSLCFVIGIPLGKTKAASTSLILLSALSVRIHGSVSGTNPRLRNSW